MFQELLEENVALSESEHPYSSKEAKKYGRVLKMLVSHSFFKQKKITSHTKPFYKEQFLPIKQHISLGQSFPCPIPSARHHSTKS